MRKLLYGFLFVAGCLLLACLLWGWLGTTRQPQHPLPPCIPCKVIAIKHVAVEQCMTFDVWDQRWFRDRATTVHYLVSRDGFVVQVSMTTWLKVKPGDEFQSWHWRRL